FLPRCPSDLYMLSLHDALPICPGYRGEACTKRRRQGVQKTSTCQAGQGPVHRELCGGARLCPGGPGHGRSHIWPLRPAVDGGGGDRKSTRLNSSHVSTAYAVFC